MLQAQNITRTIAGRRLLDHVSLNLDPGERVALTGSSGSGKSMLLRAVAMLDPLDGGHVLWQGKRVMAAEVPQYRARVCYLHQRTNLGFGSVREALCLPFQFATHRRRSFNPEYAIHLLHRFDRAADLLNQPVDNLSGGESQIVALIRVLQLEPQILLLDEPSSALDATSQLRMETVVMEWVHEQLRERAFVWVSHDAEHLKRIATRSISMSTRQLSKQANGE